MEEQALYTALSHPFRLSLEEREQIAGLLTEFPYFQAAHLLHLQNTYGEEDYARILSQSGIHIPEPRYYYRNLMLNKMYPLPDNTENVEPISKVELEKTAVGTEKETLQYAPSFYKLPQSTSSDLRKENKEETYDFIEWLNSLQKPTEPINKSPEAKKTAVAISQYINKDRIISQQSEQNLTKQERRPHTAEQLMSQTLAEIYVKQKLYDKAIAVYTKLDLNSSEKNTTFARRIEEINELKNK